LVNPVAIVFFSFLGGPLGAPVLPEFRLLQIARHKPHEGSATRATLAQNPLSMRVQRPRRSLQCDFEMGKVKAKTAISTVFLGFYGVFSCFWLFLPVFARFGQVI
jgi:hypothetical protein